MHSEKKRTEFHEKNLLPTVKFGGGSIMLWGCVASTGTGNLVKVEGHMNSSQYQQILDKNVQESVTKLKLCRGWIGVIEEIGVRLAPKLGEKGIKSEIYIYLNAVHLPFTLTSLKMYGLIWSRLSLHGSQETWLNWRCFVWRNGPKYHLPDFRDLSVAVIAAKGGSTKY